MASKLESRIDGLTAAIEKLLNREVAPIAPIAPVAPVLPIVEHNSGDHDLLITLDTKVDALKDDIRNINDGTTKTLNDHEIRLRYLESWVWKAIGAMAVLEVAIPVIMHYLKL